MTINALFSIFLIQALQVGFFKLSYSVAIFSGEDNLNHAFKKPNNSFTQSPDWRTKLPFLHFQVSTRFWLLTNWAVCSKINFTFSLSPLVRNQIHAYLLPAKQLELLFQEAASFVYFVFRLNSEVENWWIPVAFEHFSLVVMRSWNLQQKKKEKKLEHQECVTNSSRQAKLK